MIHRYGLYYPRSMEGLPVDILAEFPKGNHVMRHNPGIWNRVCSNMFIESTFIRCGHEAGGLVGVTLKPSAVSRWALSLHICSQLRVDLASLKDREPECSTTVYKEESQSRIRSDSADRQKIRETLSTFMDPLDPSNHPSGIVNVANGLVSSTSVNVDSSVTIGRQ